MKINFSEEIIGFDGEKVFKDPKQTVDNEGELVITPSTETATLADICKIALTRITIKDQNLDGVKKFEFEQLASRIYKGGVKEVTSEEIALMKQRIGVAFAPITVGASYRIFEAAKNTDNKDKT